MQGTVAQCHQSGKAVQLDTSTWTYATDGVAATRSAADADTCSDSLLANGTVLIAQSESRSTSGLDIIASFDTSISNLTGTLKTNIGYHDYEPSDDIRWTAGSAAIPAALFSGMSGPGVLIVELGPATRYLDNAEQPGFKAA